MSEIDNAGITRDQRLADEEARKILRDRVLANARQHNKDWQSSGKEADDWIDKQLNDWQTHAGRLPLPGRYSDSPNTSDELGFSEWVKSLARLLTDELLRTPAGVCIDGDWGVGKSTFMQMLKTELVRDRFTNSGWLVIWIDSSLLMSGEQVLPLVATMLLKKARERASGCLGQNIACAKPPALPWPSYLWDNIDDPPSEKDKKALTRNIKAWANKWQKKEGEREWTFTEFQALVREIRHGVLGGHGLSRIVIMIDDLDRCEPDIIWNVFCLHRILLQEPGLLFVYAMDESRVAEAIGGRLLMTGRNSLLEFQQAGSVRSFERGERFLEKFFTHKLRPPQPSALTLDKWFGKLIGVENKPTGFGEVLYWGLSANPRLIKFVANICGSMLDHLRTTPVINSDDNLWRRLTSKLGIEMAMQLLCKTVVLAYGWEPAFEPIRARLTRFRGAEAAARTSQMIPCIWGSKRFHSPIDRGLHALLTSRPAYPVDESMCADLIDAVDPYLTQSWSMHRHIGVALADTEEASIIQPGEVGIQEKRIIASQMDVKRTDEVVVGWQETNELPHELRTRLELPPPLIVADLFRRNNFNPTCQTMLRKANEIADSDPSTAQYLIAASIAIPNIDTDDFEAAIQIAAKVSSPEFGLAVYEKGISLFPEKQVYQINYFGSLLNQTDLTLRDKAMSIFCEIFNVDRHNLGEGIYDLTDISTKAWLSMLFDNAERAEIIDEALEVARAAGRNSQGKSCFIYRNIGRLLVLSGDIETGARITLASVFMDPKDNRSATWLFTSVIRAGWENLFNLADICFISAARDTDDVDNCYAVGRFLVSSEGGNKDAALLFKHTLSLSPTIDIVRQSLVSSLRKEGMHQDATNAEKESYIPTREDEKIQEKGRDAIATLWRQASQFGKIEYDGLVLFDPDAAPQWLEKEKE